MNKYQALADARISMTDLSRLTGIHQVTIKKILSNPEEYEGGPRSYKLLMVDDILQRVKDNWASGAFPAPRRKGESTDERLARLRAALLLDKNED